MELKLKLQSYFVFPYFRVLRVIRENCADPDTFWKQNIFLNIYLTNSVELSITREAISCAATQ
jgi:hypothetical protein